MKKVVLVLTYFITWTGLAGHPCLSAAELPADPDEQILRDEKIGTDNAALVAFLRKRAECDGDLLRVDSLIQQLGNSNFRERDRASRRLFALGLPALPALQHAEKSPDKEVTHRSRECRDQIARDNQRWAASGAAVRILVKRRAPNAVEALLAHIPYAPGERAQEELWYGLDTLATASRDGDSALAAALHDPLPARRAAAACILGHRGTSDQRSSVRQILGDSNPSVRLRAAQGLLAAEDPAAIPTLIGLLNNSPLEVGWQAEELLHWIAGSSAPSSLIGRSNAADRASCQLAWAQWWRQHRPTANLRGLDKDPRRPGLVVIYARRGEGPGEYTDISLCGCDCEPRWKLRTPVQVTALRLDSDGTILLEEQRPKARLTCVDLQGTLLWEHALGRSPLIPCQPLPNGNLFLATYRSVSELRPHREPEYAWDVASTYAPMFHAIRLPNGHIMCSILPNQLVELDPLSTREICRFPLPGQVLGDSHLSTSHAGSYYLTQYRSGKIVEFETSPHLVREQACHGVVEVRYLSTGNLLIRCQTHGYCSLIERNRAGKIVSEIFPADGFDVCFGLLRLGFSDTSVAVPWDLAAGRARHLRSPDDARRRIAACLLGDLGAAARDGAPDLVALLLDRDEATRGYARNALTGIGAPVLPLLTSALNQENRSLRAAAADVLADLGDAASPALPTLSRHLSDSDPRTQERVAIAIGRIGPAASKAVPALTELLRDRHLPKDVRLYVIQALGRIGRGSRTAIPDVLSTLGSADSVSKCWAVEALGLIDPADQDVLGALLCAGQDEADAALRNTAAAALKRLGPGSRDVVPKLMDALKGQHVKDPDARIQFQAAVVDALGSIGPAAQDAVPLVIECLRDRNQPAFLRENAACALGRIGRRAHSVVHALAQASAEDPDRRVKEAAAIALRRLSGSLQER